MRNNMGWRNQAKSAIQENWKLYEKINDLKHQAAEYDRALGKLLFMLTNEADPADVLEFIIVERARIIKEKKPNAYTDATVSANDQ